MPDGAKGAKADDGKYYLTADVTIREMPSDDTILEVVVLCIEGKAAVAQVYHVQERKHGGYNLVVAELSKEDLREANELRSIIAKAKQWASTARSEHVSELKKVLWTTRCGRYPSYVVNFRKSDGECELSLRQWSDRFFREAWLNEKDWDALLYLSDNLTSVLDPVQRTAINSFATQRGNATQEANEQRRKDSLFK